MSTLRIIDRMVYENKDESLKPVFDILAKTDNIPTKEKGFVTFMQQTCHADEETGKKLYMEMQEWRKKEAAEVRNYRHHRVGFMCHFIPVEGSFLRDEEGSQEGGSATKNTADEGGKEVGRSAATEGEEGHTGEEKRGESPTRNNSQQIREAGCKADPTEYGCGCLVIFSAIELQTERCASQSSD